MCKGQEVAFSFYHFDLNYSAFYYFASHFMYFLFINSFICYVSSFRLYFIIHHYLFIQLSIYLFIHSFIHSLTHSCTYSFTYLSIHIIQNSHPLPANNHLDSIIIQGIVLQRVDISVLIISTIFVLTKNTEVIFIQLEQQLAI